jgi:hypothetical protein
MAQGQPINKRAKAHALNHAFQEETSFTGRIFQANPFLFYFDWFFRFQVHNLRLIGYQISGRGNREIRLSGQDSSRL